MNFFLDSFGLAAFCLFLAWIISRSFFSSKSKKSDPLVRDPLISTESAEDLIRKFFTSEKTHFRNDFSNKFLLAQLKECQKNEEKYVEMVKGSYAALYLRHMSFTELAAVCIALRKNSISDQVKLSISSTITAASILFDFEIPPFLVRLDSFTYQMIAAYILATRRKPFYVLLDEYEKNRKVAFYENYSDERLFWLNHLTTNVMSMAHFISTENKSHPPSFTVLLHKLQSENDELWMLVNKSEENLKLLMTLTFVVLGYEIPKDCYAMNDFFFCLLKNNGHYHVPNFEEVPDNIPEGQAY